LRRAPGRLAAVAAAALPTAVPAATDLALQRRRPFASVLRSASASVTAVATRARPRCGPERTAARNRRRGGDAGIGRDHERPRPPLAAALSSTVKRPGGAHTPRGWRPARRARAPGSAGPHEPVHPRGGADGGRGPPPGATRIRDRSGPGGLSSPRYRRTTPPRSSSTLRLKDRRGAAHDVIDERAGGGLSAIGSSRGSGVPVKAARGRRRAKSQAWRRDFRVELAQGPRRLDPEGTAVCR
jgi:hypothetical protein